MVAITQRPRLALKGLAVGAAALMLFTACSSTASSPAASSAASAPPSTAASGAPASAAASPLGETSIRSNEHEKVPSASVKAMVDYCTTKTGVTAPVAITNHNEFQDKFNSFMQGTPEDIVKWFTGERLRFPAR